MDSDDEDSGQKAMQVAGAVFSKSKDIGEKHGATILAVLILFGLLYFWLVVLPKPLTVTITLAEADSNATVSGAQVEADYLASPYIFTSVKTSRAIPKSDGRYEFSGVPSNTEGIVLRVRKTTEYENYNGQISTEGSAKTMPVTLFKKTLLRMESTFVSGSIAPSCTKAFNVPILNNDTENDAEVALLSDKLPYFKADKRVISAGETANATFSITTNYPDSDKNPAFVSGEVRIRGTKASVVANITITKKPDLSLDTNEIQNKIGETKLVKITNAGKGAITGVRLAMDDSSRRLVSLTGLNENSAFDLEAGQAKKVYITSVDAGIGIITVSADCTAPLQLPVKISAPD